MKLINPSWKKLERLTFKMQMSVMVAAVLMAAMGLLALSHPPKDMSPMQSRFTLPRFDLANIGKGPLGLIPKKLSPVAELLAQELILIGKNTRPDSWGSFPISLGLKSSGDRQDGGFGQKIYLSQDGDSYRFSKTATDVMILPFSLSGEQVLLQMTQMSGFTDEIVITPSVFFQRSVEDESYFQCVKKGKVWTSDQLLHQWGGEEYHDLSLKHKVELGGRVYFLDVGDKLWWDGMAWRRGAPEEAETPLLQLTSSNAGGIQLEVWDSTGYANDAVEIALQQSPQMGLKTDEMITAIRPRSPTEITCQLGQRRVIVKEGDWWVKTGRRWRPLKTARDLDAFLHHEIQGELVMFEKVEIGKGKVSLKGRCFDKMRTQSQPIALVVNTEKKSSSTHSRHEPSRSSMIAKNKMPPSDLGHQQANQNQELKP